MTPNRPAARSQRIFALVLVLLAFAAPAVSDVLVTQDDGRITTQGPWRVEGALVVFRLEDGSLGSMRLSAIDLDASREATEEATRPAPPPAVAPARESVTTVTDRDVRRAIPAPAEATEPEAAAATTAGDRLRVTEWRQEDLPDGSGTAIVGTVENTGPDALGRIRIQADLYNDEGTSFASHEVLVHHATLMPGQKTEFRVALPDLFAFTGVRFTTEALPLAVSVPGEETGESATDDEGPDGAPE